MDSKEIYEAFMDKYQKIMSITIGALIEYIQDEKFNDLTEDQKDALFGFLVMGWGEMMPPRLEHMWHRHLAFLALDHHLEEVQNEKIKEETSQVVDNIFKDLGWDKL